MISWNCSGPNRPDERIINRPLSRKRKLLRSVISILYPLRHSLIIIFTLHILLLYLYVSHTPFTRAILVVDYYGVLALLAHRVRPFRFWFIIVDDIILIRCKLLGCVMHVAICSPVIVSDVFLLAREQISDYKEVLDTDSNYYIFFPSISRINLIVIAPIFLYFPLFA